ncbi:bifunctional precorrin-2 dehydrogenase/sirohydrochlorin ferrochelatase MET8 [Sporobolomyces salmoneus]|uniref:bifunctional precorrin-2 dehydrogenase/sirohydrochlorin ferrochelatase MET8 n=1 Tax=Sporobolomyces salmoneus TaxID=183962 RepID=UPI003175214B
MISPAPSSSSSSSPPYPAIEPSSSLFLAYQLRSKTVLLVGGGVVGASRLYHVLCALPRKIILVAPESGLSPETLYRLEQDRLLPSESRVIEWKNRSYGEGDEQGMDMVLTAIDEQGLSSSICKRCRELKIPVNVADVPSECDFYFGSTLRNGPLSVMVSTNGKGPRIAARLRRKLEGSIPDNAGKALENTGKLRLEMRKLANGKKKEDIDRRMDFMSRVCDKWSVEQLKELDEEMIKRVLEGWEEGRALGYWDVNKSKYGRLGYLLSWTSQLGLGSCPVKRDPDGRASRCPFVMGTSGIVVGVAVTLGALRVLSYSRRT